MEKEIAIIRLVDKDDLEDIRYFVLKDEKFEENLKKLEKLVNNYDTFQEIEDFIYENFIEQGVEEISFYY